MFSVHFSFLTIECLPLMYICANDYWNFHCFLVNDIDPFLMAYMHGLIWCNIRIWLGLHFHWTQITCVLWLLIVLQCVYFCFFFLVIITLFVYLFLMSKSKVCNNSAELGHTTTKTRLYDFNPLKPHFYIVKLGFTGVYIIFLILLKKNIDCGTR